MASRVKPFTSRIWSKISSRPEVQTKVTQTTRERNNAGMLGALNGSQRHVYAGTVSPAEKAKRRAKNKAARVARRAGRR